jgi:hypothetical protein
MFTTYFLPLKRFRFEFLLQSNSITWLCILAIRFLSGAILQRREAQRGIPVGRADRHGRLRARTQWTAELSWCLLCLKWQTPVSDRASCGRRLSGVALKWLDRRDSPFNIRPRCGSCCAKLQGFLVLRHVKQPVRPGAQKSILRWMVAGRMPEPLPFFRKSS